MMRQLGNLKFLVIFSILFLINDTSGLRCWRCSSDASSSKYCGETLDLSQINEQQKRWSYVECPDKVPKELEKIENLIPVCKIVLQHVNEIPVYSRSCSWAQENALANSCANQTFNPSYVKNIACKTCKEDGCNDKLLNDSEEEDNKSNLADNLSNSAVFTVLSNIVFATFMLCMIIGY